MIFKMLSNHSMISTFMPTYKCVQCLDLLEARGEVPTID